eukprot:2049550-Rhodomonas_salina.2
MQFRCEAVRRSELVAFDLQSQVVTKGPVVIPLEFDLCSLLQLRARTACQRQEHRDTIIQPRATSALKGHSVGGTCLTARSAIRTPASPCPPTHALAISAHQAALPLHTDTP